MWGRIKDLPARPAACLLACLPACLPACLLASELLRLPPVAWADAFFLRERRLRSLPRARHLSITTIVPRDPISADTEKDALVCVFDTKSTQPHNPQKAYSEAPSALLPSSLRARLFPTRLRRVRSSPVTSPRLTHHPHLPLPPSITSAQPDRKRNGLGAIDCPDSPCR